MKEKLYTITLTNWSKYNANRKPNHKHSLIPDNFCWDSKLDALPRTHGWLFLALVLITGSSMKATVEVTEKQLRTLLKSSRNVEEALNTMQSFQLLTWTVLECKDVRKRLDVATKEPPRSKTSEVSSPVEPEILGTETAVLQVPDQEEFPLGAEAVGEPKATPLTPQSLFEGWNRRRGSLPECKVLSDGRRKLAKSQLVKYPDHDHWLEVIEKWSESEFVTGQWRPNFDDFLKEGKRISTLEGKYDNRGHMNGSAGKPHVSRTTGEGKW